MTSLSKVERVKRSCALRGILAGVLLAGCSTIPRPFNKPKGPYGDALEKATRSSAVYNSFDAEMYVYATNETPSFKRARTDRLVELYKVPAVDIEQVNVDLVEKFEGHVFFLAVNTNDRFANELDRPGSPWAVTLETPAGVVRPATILRVNTRLNTIRGLYPYVDRFFMTYRVIFPASVGNGPYDLVVAGPLGSTRMKFEGDDEQP